MSSGLLLPEAARLIHIGPQKTGSTAIQVAMFEARDQLETHGAYYPRGSYRRRRAGWALGLPGGHTNLPIELWENLASEVSKAGDARVCISDESYARADESLARRIVEDLGGTDAYVIAVARRLDLFLPSQYQERVKSGIGDTYADWLRVVLDGQMADAEHRNVWMGHDTPRLIERWTQFVDPDRFLLLVADESDRAQLPRTFEGLLGLPEGMLRTDPARSNRSLTVSEVELVRRLVVTFSQRGWSRDDYKAFVTRGVIDALARRPADPSAARSAPLPDWAFERAQALSAERIDAIKAAPVRLLGDLEHLRVPASRAVVDQPESPRVDIDAVTDVVTTVIAAALERANARDV